MATVPPPLKGSETTAPPALAWRVDEGAMSACGRTRPPSIQGDRWHVDLSVGLLATHPFADVIPGTRLSTVGLVALPSQYG